MIRPPNIRRRSCWGSRRLCLLLFLLGVTAIPFVLFARLRAHNATYDPVLEPNGSIVQEQRRVHFIYTVGCGGSSDHNWQLVQSNALDQSFITVKQRGRITRLVSGCMNDPENSRYMKRSVLSHLEVVFVPSLDRVEVDSATRETRTYVQANRPTALQYFFNLDEIRQSDRSTVYIVLDPDFIFRTQVPEEYIGEVQFGRFVSHAYGLQDPTPYAYKACQEALNATGRSGTCEMIKGLRSYRRYFAGVPYMLTREDWLKVVDLWIPLIGPVLLRYPGIESDMISWAIAAALVGLESRLKSNFMATCMSSEKADVESVLKKQVFLHLCQSYYVPETRGNQYRVNPVKGLHYILSHKEWFDGVEFVYVFNKHWLKRSKLLDDCTIPLLAGPPPLPSAISRQATKYYNWHQAVIEESVAAYNKAVEEFRKKVLLCTTTPPPNKVLILHERHASSFNGGWNHVIDA